MDQSLMDELFERIKVLGEENKIYKIKKIPKCQK